MTARENALRIIRFDAPERVVEGLPSHGIRFHGADHESFDGVGHDSPVGTEWTDIWGTVWRKEQEGVMGFPVRYPLRNVSDLAGYTWPDPDDERICRRIYRDREGFDGGDRFLVGSHRSTLWHRIDYLVGMDAVMLYFFTEPEFVRDVLHSIMDFNMGIARHYADVGVEAVGLSDDLGMQSGLLMSPETIDEFLMPEYRRLISYHKERDVLVEFHSCGRIHEMVERFIDLGVDTLNPLQETANDLATVREMTQGRLALRGGVRSDLVLSGPIEAIEEAVREKIGLLGKEGGYFCRIDQGLPFPQEHLGAFHRAVEQYGRYPLE